MIANQEEQKKSITEAVLNKINSGDIKMTPRIYFILRAALLVFFVFTLTLFIIYIISFILFSLRASGLWFLPRFGLFGIKIFFSSLPWFLILLAVIVVIILEVLAKHFSFIYRRPVVYSLLGIVIIVLAISFLIDKTPFHPDLFRMIKDRPLPIVSHFYRDFGAPRMHDVHYGIVSEIKENGFVIETPRGESINIIVASGTRFLKENDIQKDDVIVVLGQRDDHTVNAIEIREVGENIDIFPLPPSFPRNRPPR